MSDLFSLKGRTAFITGASRGLGEAIARGFARAGADLILAARNNAKLQQLAHEFQDLGVSARTVAFDLSDIAAVEATAKRIAKEGGSVDILVNNAGVAGWSPLPESTLPDWDAIFRINSTATYLLCRELSKGMIEQRWGRIINFSSYVGETGRPNLSAYSASKAAVSGMTRAIAADLAPYNITCNAIAPGVLKTDMAAPTAGNPKRAKVYQQAIAMGRFGEPDEIIGPVQFLASEAGSYVTGQTLHVGGGIGQILSMPVVVEE